MHRTGRGRAFCRGVGQFESLFDLELRQPFDLQDAAREDVLLALFLNRKQPLLDRVVRDRVDQVAQRDARVHRPLEAHQH